MKLPLFLKKYFWNVAFTRLSSSTDETLIAERLLEFGSPVAIRWLLKNIPQRAINEVIKRRRALSPQSRFFWAAYFHIPKSQIACLEKSSLQRRKTLWPY